MREIFLVFLIASGVYSFGFILKTYMEARMPHYEEYVMVGD